MGGRLTLGPSVVLRVSDTTAPPITRILPRTDQCPAHATTHLRELRTRVLLGGLDILLLGQVDLCERAREVAWRSGITTIVGESVRYFSSYQRVHDARRHAVTIYTITITISITITGGTQPSLFLRRHRSGSALCGTGDGAEHWGRLCVVQVAPRVSPETPKAEGKGEWNQHRLHREKDGF